MLQNLIWLVVRNRSSEKRVRLAISHRLIVGYLALLCLSLKAAILGPFIGVGAAFGKYSKEVMAFLTFTKNLANGCRHYLFGSKR